jgi:hypothetical protein
MVPNKSGIIVEENEEGGEVATRPGLVGECAQTLGS